MRYERGLSVHAFIGETMQKLADPEIHLRSENQMTSTFAQCVTIQET